MESQRDARIAKRMPCTVRVGEERFSGLVLNLSTGGVYVQTRAEPTRGHAVGVELQAPDESAGIPLSGTVAWRRIVPGQLHPVAGAGFGVRIRQADDRYYDALARWRGVDLGSASEGLAAEPTEPDPPAWRVRVRATASPRSRTVTVEAADEADARDKALAHVGARWTVIEVDAL